MPPQVTDDPGMHGVAHGLSELYDGLTTAEIPERWRRMAEEIEGNLSETGSTERN
jgi:uncharacterized protein YjeT (DUF2065 family)